MDALIETLLTFRNIMKVFHWRTTSYPRHVASDAFVTQFDTLVDRFMEVYIGRYGRRNGEAITRRPSPSPHQDRPWRLFLGPHEHSRRDARTRQPDGVLVQPQ
jgi:hypothetical protein